ncbi:MAG: lysophospholipid acyltransferase family protein [Planctomycetota bacterium]
MSDSIAECGDVYQPELRSPSWIGRVFPSLSFYQMFVANVIRSSRIARRGQYDGETWARSSFKVLTDLQSIGASVRIEGLDQIRKLETPCVFVANHMSTLETMVLPAIIQPIRPVTFVVKKSLLEYPFFKHIVGSRNPIAVSRENAREDLKTVTKLGVERLRDGISIVVFPQTTRSTSFDAKKFNSIGVKLAAKAKVPLMPVALRTDAWGNGNLVKDFGPVDTSLPVRFAFGSPLPIIERGAEQHQQAIEFIESKLRSWSS